MPHKAQPNTPKKPRPDRRPSASARGYDANWRRFRLSYRARNPLCSTPGCRQAAEHVDHKTALNDGGDKFDESNLQSLCHSCHSRKTVAVDGGFGRPRVEQATHDHPSREQR